MHFNRLPGIGPKTAERLVFYIINQSNDQKTSFAQAIEDLKNNVIICETCNTLSEHSPCIICKDLKRNQEQLCVVASTFDQSIIEETKKYFGRYHILGGTINVIDGVTPDKLTMKSLAERINTNTFTELILAFNQDIEGETTTQYIKNLFQHKKLKITRLARGIPLGANLEYTDEITLANSIIRREEI